MSALIEFLRRIWETFVGFANQVLVLLNPVYAWNAAIMFIQSILPPANPAFQLTMTNMLTALLAIREFFWLADYFVNVPMLLYILGTMTAVEGWFVWMRISQAFLRIIPRALPFPV